jgi:hypothetical protein
VSSTKPSHEKSTASRRPNSLWHSIDTEVELRKIAERDSYRLNLQVTQLSRELDQQRQKTKEVEADKKRLAGRNCSVEKGVADKRRRDCETRRKDGNTRQGNCRHPRERGESRLRKGRAQAIELKAQVEKLSTDNENLQKEKEDTEQKMKEELEKEKELREKEKEAIAAAAASKPPTPPTEHRVSYIPMPRPPIPPNIPTSGPVPRTTSAGSRASQSPHLWISPPGSEMPSPPRSFSRLGNGHAGSNHAHPGHPILLRNARSLNL